MEKLIFSPYNCVSCGKPKSREEDELCAECIKKASEHYPDGGPCAALRICSNYEGKRKKVLLPARKGLPNEYRGISLRFRKKHPECSGESSRQSHAAPDGGRGKKRG